MLFYRPCSNISGNGVAMHEINSMKDSHRKEILRRYEYVKKALEFTRYEQTQGMLKKARDEVARDLREDIPKPNKSNRPGKGKNRNNAHKRCAPSVRTLYRWLRAFIASGQNIRSLISDNMVNRTRESSLDPEVIRIIDKKIDVLFLSSARIGVGRLHREIESEIKEYNRSLPDFKKDAILSPPPHKHCACIRG